MSCFVLILGQEIMRYFPILICCMFFICHFSYAQQQKVNNNGEVIYSMIQKIRNCTKFKNVKICSERVTIKFKSNDDPEKLCVPNKIIKKNHPPQKNKKSSSPSKTKKLVYNTRMITIYGTSWCNPCGKLKAYLSAKNIDFVFIDVEKQDFTATSHVYNMIKEGVPVVIYSNGHVDRGERIYGNK